MAPAVSEATPESSHNALAEQHPGQDREQAADLLRGQLFAGRGDAQQNSGDRIQQADQADGSRAQLPESGDVAF